MIALAECAAHSGKPPHIEKEIGKRREQRLKSWNIVNCGSSFGKMSIYTWVSWCPLQKLTPQVPHPSLSCNYIRIGVVSLLTPYAMNRVLT